VANNRLYLGHKKSKLWILLTKGFGSGWHGLSKSQVDLLEEFFGEPEHIGESDISRKTDLVLFSEYDDLYEEVMGESSDWRNLRDD
jgi:hypothetical protein